MIPTAIEPTPSRPDLPRDPVLYGQCRQFEEVMTSTLLKQSLTQAAQAIGTEEEESGNGAFTEMAYEQLAGQIGKMGMLGLADVLYRQLTGTNQSTPDRKATP